MPRNDRQKRGTLDQQGIWGDESRPAQVRLNFFAAGFFFLRVSSSIE